MTKIRDKRKTIKEAEELASCTFRPKINQTNATKIDKSRARASIVTKTTKAKRAQTTKRLEDDVKPRDTTMTVNAEPELKIFEQPT